MWILGTKLQSYPENSDQRPKRALGARTKDTLKIELMQKSQLRWRGEAALRYRYLSTCKYRDFRLLQMPNSVNP